MEKTHHLTYSKSSEVTVSNIDKRGFLNLSLANAKRADLAMFALALGYHSGVKAPAGGTAFVREEYILPNSMNQIVAIVVGEVIDNSASDFDRCCNQAEVMTICSQYSDSGMAKIQEMMDNTPNSEKGKESAIWTLIDALDDCYNKLFPDDAIAFD